MAVIRIERDREWLVVVIERPKRTRRVYLSTDEAAYLNQLLARELGQAGRLRRVSVVTDLHRLSVLVKVGNQRFPFRWGWWFSSPNGAGVWGGSPEWGVQRGVSDPPLKSRARIGRPGFRA
jgi:hypothetical protein